MMLFLKLIVFLAMLVASGLGAASVIPYPDPKVGLIAFIVLLLVGLQRLARLAVQHR